MFEQARPGATRAGDRESARRIAAIGRPELSVRTKAAGGDDETNDGLNNAEPIGLALIELSLSERAATRASRRATTLT